ncbi:MAG TPA: TonB-dependent receptor [Gammaproteobacteria bacterium]|nr:TonB-dependent receptor [Gammaproteobacteria bacterium]
MADASKPYRRGRRLRASCAWRSHGNQPFLESSDRYGLDTKPYRALFLACSLSLCAIGSATAADGGAAREDLAADAGASGEDVDESIEITGQRLRLVTPLPGVSLDDTQLTTNAQTADAARIRDSGAVNTTQFLNEQLQSITVADNAGNPFQQDIVYRGFSASPLIATPQGLSVYLDGARVNEAFGDVVNWDLIPLNAIEGLALMPGSNPLFGLNTLGGALSMTTKSGFTAPGVDASVLGGSWGRHQVQISAGIGDDHLGALVAFNRLREDGWRDDSPSELNQVFGRVDARAGFASATASVLHVDNSLAGNGQVPSEDWRRRPEQIYTAPDAVENLLTQGWLTTRFDLTDQLSISAMAFLRDSAQRSVNGDFWDGWNAATSGRVDACDPNGIDGVADGARGDNTLADGANAGTGPGIPGCIPNGVLGRGTTDQSSHGYSLQLNWLTDRNQLALGGTIDSNRVDFEQSEQLGDIAADRSVIVDPERAFPFDKDDLAAFEAFLDLQTFLDLHFPNDPVTQQLFIDEIKRENGGVLPTAPSLRVGDILSATEVPILRNRLDGRNSAWAVFFYDTLNVLPSLNLSFGARYSRTRVSNRVRADRPTPLHQFTPDLLARRQERCGVEDGDENARFQCTAETFEYQSFTPSFGLNWQAREGLMLFANYSRGSRTPSAIELACARDKGIVDPDVFQGCTIPTALSNDPYLPQVRSTSYELGGRGLLRDTIDWNVAAYRTDLSNDILFVSLGIGNRGVFDSFGRTRRQGVELGLAGDDGRLRWFFNYAFVEATFEDPATIINLSNSTSRKVQGELNEFTIQPGDTIPGVPRHALRAGASWTLSDRFTLGLTAIAQATSFVRGNENNDHRPGGTDADDSPRPRARRYVGDGALDGFAIFNLDASFDFTERVAAFVQVDNLFDKRFATAGTLGLNSFTESRYGRRDASGFNYNSNDWTHSQFVGPGAPRAVWVGLRYAH